MQERSEIKQRGTSGHRDVVIHQNHESNTSDNEQNEQITLETFVVLNRTDILIK